MAYFFSVDLLVVPRWQRNGSLLEEVYNAFCNILSLITVWLTCSFLGLHAWFVRSRFINRHLTYDFFLRFLKGNVDSTRSLNRESTL